jgi:signal transduction histidine kinase
VTLIAETTAYHVIVGGEAEVLALGNLFLTIGFLAAFPWGGWPQLAVASAACAGLAVGLFSDVHASVSGGIVIAGVLSLGGLSVVAAILTDRYRYSLFLTREELAVAYEHLKATQSQLVHSEKMASLGELVGGVTHELNNPTSFVHGGLSNLATYVSAFIELIKAFDGAPIADPAAAAQIAALKRRLEMDYLLRETPALLAICLQGSERIMKIIEDLRLFVRADQSGRVPTDVAAGLDRTVQMLGDRMGHSGITVIRNYELTPLVEANVAQLNQAWMHLLRNAIDAVESRTGAAIRLVIKYQQLGMGAERAEVDFDAPLTSYVEVRVEDNGVGISAATRERVFEPFFTTKPIGRGTGLGLSIAYGAIKSHRGTIAIESEPGRGTRVTVRLPIQNGAGLPHR